MLVKSLTLAIGACTYKIKLKAMKTELTEWQRKKVRGIIRNVFASTFEKLFYSSIARVDDIPQVDDITTDQIVEASTAYMFTLYDNDRDTKIAFIHSYTEGLKGEIIDEVVFAVVNKTSSSYGRNQAGNR